MTTNLFRMTQFRKNASVTPFVSHTFKTKDLKPFRITHFQKMWGGACARSGILLSTLNCHLSTLLAKSFNINTYEIFVCNSFIINTYKKGGEGVGGYPMTTIAIPKWDSHSVSAPDPGQHGIARTMSRSPGIKSPAVTSEGLAQPAAPPPNLFTPADVASILHERNWLGAVESPEIVAWRERAAALLGPHAANRDELAELLALVFRYDAREILQQVESHLVLAREGARLVIRHFRPLQRDHHRAQGPRPLQRARAVSSHSSGARRALRRRGTRPRNSVAGLRGSRGTSRERDAPAHARILRRPGLGIVIPNPRFLRVRNRGDQCNSGRSKC